MIDPYRSLFDVMRPTSPSKVVRDATGRGGDALSATVVDHAASTLAPPVAAEPILRAFNHRGEGLRRRAVGTAHRATFAALFAALAIVLATREVRAEATAWFAVSGGATSLAQAGMQRTTAPALHLDVGVGTSPARALIIGGLLKSLTSFGHGTDLALMARFATGGFVRGGWGAAADVGPYQRWWGGQSTGVLGALVVGAPYGLQVSVFMEQGTKEARAYGAAVGVDLLRLTVFRTSTQSTWYNPILPAGTER